MRRIIIFGGSGFVGQAIAEAALSTDYQIVSISRHGKPEAGNGMDQIEWIAADVFKPEIWQKEIRVGDIVIDSIGILFEKRAKGITYEKFHYQAADLISKEAKKCGASQMLYISAANGLPFFKEYLTQKRRAEAVVLNNFPDATIISPSLMFGSQRKGTIPLAKMLLWVKNIPLFSKIVSTVTPEPVNQVAKEIIQTIVAADIK